ncbi:retinol dehydrogenase 12-like [Ostrea edulis]|uniref:retinol dehydrogenase 12-like n=1 Tax=Ostrea edulis TaxID=37623 RepID=UPI0024B000FD|nr:retinol dehydrogenase 12-like [Ostrea edulis]
MEGWWKFDTEHQTIIACVAVTGVTLYALRLWVAGGKCYSKVRLDKKTVIITGANTGIGKETAIDLAGRGAKVILACRDRCRGERALSDVIRKSGSKQVVLKMLDLASLESVRKFAQDINENEPRLDILINNAGVMMCPLGRTAEGFEMQLGTNHLGHFLLTNLLLDKMKKSAPARIVNVSSYSHTYTNKINFDDINSEKSYSRTQAYAQSKLANILFTRELSKRLKGTGVTANSLHPGVVITELARYIPGYNIAWPLFIFIMKFPREGAQTSIQCAVEETLESVSGKYFSDCAVSKESKAAQDNEAAKRLWDVSVKMVGLEE